MTEIRTIKVGELDIPMRASALVPRLYRAKFGRDMMRDLLNLRNKFKRAAKDENADGDDNTDGGDSGFDEIDLTIFENVAWMLAKHADPTVPSEPDDWLDSIPGILSIYEALPQILALWSDNLKTTSSPRKK